MPSYVTAKKNTEYIFYIGLPSVADGNIFQANPTLAAGDFKVSTGGAALANPATLPSVDPAGSKAVKVTLSASEMNADNIQLICSDAAGGEWKDVIINIQTTTQQIDDLSSSTSITGVNTNVDAAETAILAAVAALNNLSSAQVESLLTATVADSVPADGTRPSIRSGILMLVRMLQEASIAGTTLTVTKEDGSTPSMTFTLNSATSPSSITRTS